MSATLQIADKSPPFKVIQTLITNQSIKHTRKQAISQSMKRMSIHSHTNDRGDVIIDIDALEKAQKNAKNEQSTKRLKETKSIRTKKGRSRTFWIILKITLLVTAFILITDYYFDESMDERSMNETQRALKSEVKHGHKLGQGTYADVYAYWNGQEFIAGKQFRGKHSQKNADDELRYHKEALEVQKGIQPKVNAVVELKRMSNLNRLHTWWNGSHGFEIPTVEMKTIDDRPTLFFELMGKDLREYLNGGNSLTEGQIRDLIENVDPFLEEFHKQELMHRDIKAENFLINQNGKIKLCDFGLPTHVHDFKDNPNGNGTRRYSSRLNDMGWYAKRMPWGLQEISGAGEEMKRQLHCLFSRGWTYEDIAEYIDGAGWLGTLITILDFRADEKLNLATYYTVVEEGVSEQMLIERWDTLKKKLQGKYHACIVDYVETQITRRKELEKHFKKVWDARKESERM